MKVLSYPELRTEKGINFSRQWIQQLAKSGRFPKPIALGESKVAFVESEVDSWLQDRIAERDASAAA